AIDYVTSDFIDLLNYSKEIEPERNRKYEEHDRLQQAWEEHFRDRYGEPVEETNVTSVVEEAKPEPININTEEALARAAKANPGVKFYTYELEDGTKVSFAVNLEEVTADKIRAEYVNMPKLFHAKYTKFFLNHPKADEKLLLSLACAGKQMKDWGNFFGKENYSEEELEKLNKNVTNQINKHMYSVDELYEIMNEIYTDFENQNSKFMTRVNQAMMEYSTRLDVPNKSYLKQLIAERYEQMDECGLIPEDVLEDDKIFTHAKVFEQSMDSIRAMKSHNIVYLSTRSLEAGLSFLRIGNLIDNYPEEMDKIMRKYSAPLTNSEQSKILKVFMDTMLNMDTSETESFRTPELSAFYTASMEALKLKENIRFKKEFANMVLKLIVTPDNTTLRYLIDPEADKNLKDAKVEIEVSRLMQANTDIFKMLASLNDEIMDKYIKKSCPELYFQLKSYRARHRRV
ncbi:MAG: hypothetical protein K2F57_01125, partial [Candidatus Gastranaerophilales bacterium]|nr:hypothetical protein [Candidatus Gastranaerophilales bacterium]